MDATKQEDLLEFIKEHRSNEANFPAIHQKLEGALQEATPGSAYHNALTDVKQKHLPTYLKAKESGSPSWPEFENFVAEFERSVVDTIRQEEESR